MPPSPGRALCILTVLAASTCIDTAFAEVLTSSTSTTTRTSSASRTPPEHAKTPINWRSLVRFDKGGIEGRRDFISAVECQGRPCVLTRDGAIRFELPDPKRFQLNLWTKHRGVVTRIDVFEKRSAGDYFIVERVFRRKRNKKVWSLLDRIAAKEMDTIYIYGVILQYKLDDGDPLMLEVIDRDDIHRTRTYYFRYYRDGWHVRFDIALLFPINEIQVPAQKDPQRQFRSSKLNAAVTLELVKNRDPDLDYNWFEKALHSIRPSIFAGFLRREQVLPPEDVTRVVPEDQTDIFIGAGITFLDFLFAGWGLNVINKPRSSGPFVGIQVAKAIGFVAETYRSNPERWDDYRDIEEQRDIYLDGKKQCSASSVRSSDCSEVIGPQDQ